MRLRDLLTRRPARKGETPGTVEPDDAPASDIDARPRFARVLAYLDGAYPKGWASCPDCGRPAGIGISHVCRPKPPS